MISARGLRKSFGDFEAVKGIDVDVRRGEAFGFLGPNGAGKSSTMRMIAAVSPVSGGELRILGMDPATDGPAIRGRLGVCPQEDTLDNELNVRDNLYIYGRYFGIAKADVSRAGRRAARVRAADREGQVEGRGPLRRHEAPAHDRPLPDQPARPAAARRADHRPRPAGPPRAVGPAVPAQAGRRDAGDHHALHGRGRAAVRPAGRHGQGPDRRRGVAARADRGSTPPARSPSSGSACGEHARALAEKVADLGERVEVLPDRLLVYSRRRRGGHRQGARARPRAGRVLVRRSTLEDVFLRLTGRTLVD